MSNPYYQRTHPFTRHTTARGGAVQEEFDNIEEAFNKIPDVANFYSGSITYGVDTGAANAHVVNIEFGAEDPAAGVHVAFVAAGTNTGQATLKYGTWNEKQIKRVDGSELLAADIRQGQLLELRYTGTYWVITGVSTTGVFEAAEDAQNSKNAASESADLAQAWATNPENQEVVPGGGEFSSQHHALKSAASAQKADQWANEAVDTEVEPNKFSGKHWATKAEFLTAGRAFNHLYGGKSVHFPGLQLGAGQDGKWIVIDPLIASGPVAASLPDKESILAGWSVVMEFSNDQVLGSLPSQVGKQLLADADILLNGVKQDYNGLKGMTVFYGMVIRFTWTGLVWFAEFLQNPDGVSGHVTNVSEVVIDLTPYLEGGWGSFELDIDLFDPVTTNATLRLLSSSDGGTSWGTSYANTGWYLSESATVLPYSTVLTYGNFISTTASRARGRAILRLTPNGFTAEARTNAVNSAGQVIEFDFTIQNGFAANAIRLAASSGNIAELRYSLRKIARP